MRFWLCTWVELPAYAARKGRHGQAALCAACAAAYWAAMAALWRVAPMATLWSLVVPFFVSTFALMFGNWSQHVFVDPDEPRNNYRRCACCCCLGECAVGSAACGCDCPRVLKEWRGLVKS